MLKALNAISDRLPGSQLVDRILGRFVETVDAGACTPNAFDCCAPGVSRDCYGHCNTLDDTC